VDCSDAAGILRKSIESGNGILLTIAHFGAVEFLVPSLSTYKVPLNAALRFTTEQFSRMAAQQSRHMEESGLFGPIKFIEIGKPGTAAALEMAAAIRRKEVLVSVFDEKTPYSKPVFLFGKKVYGGSGLDKLLAFTNATVDLFTAFMIRDGNDSYKLELFKLPPDRDGMLDMMYHHLENMVRLACEQWYFLHEEIPFV
jgi:lauroyl/myristoyl acyltransferase